MAINLLKRAKEQVFNNLEADGQRIVNEAWWSAECKKRSGNLHDAFGYAIYDCGRMVRHGYAQGGEMSSKEHKGWAKHGIPAMKGREAIDKFFSEYSKEVSQSSITLICVNAVFYAQILEDGAQKRPRSNFATRYRIISQVSSKMHNLESKFKGSNLSVISPVGGFHGGSGLG